MLRWFITWLIFFNAIKWKRLVIIISLFLDIYPRPLEQLERLLGALVIYIIYNFVCNGMVVIVMKGAHVFIG